MRIGTTARSAEPSKAAATAGPAQPSRAARALDGMPAGRAQPSRAARALDGMPAGRAQRDSLGERVQQAARVQRERLPGPSELCDVARTAKTWRRKLTDPDFGLVRIATAPRPVSASRSLPEQPVAVSLRALPRVTITGRRCDTLDLARAMLAHLVTFHHPLTLRVVWRADRRREQQWQWLRRIPHNRDTTGIAHTVLLLDDPALSDVDDQRGATILDVSGAHEAADRAGLALVADGDTVGMRTAAGIIPIGETDRLSLADAQNLAELLAFQGEV